MYINMNAHVIIRRQICNWYKLGRVKQKPNRMGSPKNQNLKTQLLYTDKEIFKQHLEEPLDTHCHRYPFMSFHMKASFLEKQNKETIRKG